jgi:hypothetical protein
MTEREHEIRRHLLEWDPVARLEPLEPALLETARREVARAARREPAQERGIRLQAAPAWALAAGVATLLLAALLRLAPPRQRAGSIVAAAPQANSGRPVQLVLAASNGTHIYWSAYPENAELSPASTPATGDPK